MRRPREATALFLVLCTIALGVFGWILWGSVAEGRTRVRYEDLARARIEGLARAQRAYHQKTGRYGWVEDLESAGLLGDFGIEKDVGAAAGGLMYLTSPRYRLDVLLPHRLTRSGQALLALRSGGKRSPALEKEHFVLAARPWSEETGGYRTFVLDETARLYVSEGVSDEMSMERRPLPELHPSLGGVTVTGGMRLYPIDDLPAR